MLRIRYNLATGLLTGWESDVVPRDDTEAVVELSVDKPDNDDYENFRYIDGELMPSGKTLGEPLISTHISIIDAIDIARARPVRIRRMWRGKDHFYDCFVTEFIKDQYVAGNIAIGDYVIVHFDDIGEQIVTAKIFKSW